MSSFSNGECEATSFRFFGVCVRKSVCSYALVSYQYLEQGGVGEGKQIVINNTAFLCCLGNPK